MSPGVVEDYVLQFSVVVLLESEEDLDGPVETVAIVTDIDYETVLLIALLDLDVDLFEKVFPGFTFCLTLE